MLVLRVKYPRPWNASANWQPVLHHCSESLCCIGHCATASCKCAKSVRLAQSSTDNKSISARTGNWTGVKLDDIQFGERLGKGSSAYVFRGRCEKAVGKDELAIKLVLNLGDDRSKLVYVSGF